MLSASTVSKARRDNNNNSSNRNTSDQEQWAKSVVPGAVAESEGEPRMSSKDKGSQALTPAEIAEEARLMESKRAMLTRLNSKSKMQQVSCRRQLWMLLEEPSLHWASLAIHHVYSALTIFSVVTTTVLTVEDLPLWCEDLLQVVDVFFNATFSLEVVVRIICAPRLDILAKNMYLWIDIAAVLPFYIVTLPNLDTDENPLLELLILLVPVFRLLKVTRHSSGWRLLMYSLTKVAPPLAVPFFLLIIMVVTSACMIFWIEKHAVPDLDGRAFANVPHAMWFSIVTISTVGYGDVSPNSALGKLATCFLILMGVCYMAMPLTIVGGEFSNVWDARDKILMRMTVLEKMAQGGILQEHLEELFRATDADNSGAMTRSEFTTFLNVFNLGVTPNQMIRLFKSIDDNNSGEICFEEFAEFLFPDYESNDVTTPMDARPTDGNPCDMARNAVVEISPLSLEALSDDGGTALSPSSEMDPFSSKSTKPVAHASDNPLERRVERIERLLEDLGANQRRYFQNLTALVQQQQNPLPCGNSSASIQMTDMTDK